MDALNDWLTAQLDEAAQVQQAIRAMQPLLLEVAGRLADAFEQGQQAFFFGNGGSAADAQHWAAELSGRFYYDRPGLPAHALSTNASQVTAIGNDYGYDQVFSRPLAGMGQPGDVAVGISTSGNSANVVRALQTARAQGLVTVGFTGRTGGQMAPLCDYLIRLPSDDVARIQEGHECCAHLICGVVERLLFPQAVATR